MMIRSETYLREIWVTCPAGAGGGEIIVKFELFRHPLYFNRFYQASLKPPVG